MARKIKICWDGEVQPVEVVEDLGYQIMADVYVVRATAPDGKEYVFTSSKKRGIYTKHRPHLVPGGRVVGM